MYYLNFDIGNMRGSTCTTNNLALSARTVKITLKTKAILGVVRVLAQDQNSEEYNVLPMFQIMKKF